MINKSSIGKIIKNLRMNKKLTQEELSEKVDISKNYLSKIERGLSVLNTETFLKMATVLDFTLDDFGIKAGIVTDETKKELIERILSLSNEEANAFLQLLNTMNLIIKSHKSKI